MDELVRPSSACGFDHRTGRLIPHGDPADRIQAQTSFSTSARFPLEAIDGNATSARHRMRRSRFRDRPARAAIPKRSRRPIRGRRRISRRSSNAWGRRRGHSQSGIMGHHMARILKDRSNLNLLKGLVTLEGSCSLPNSGLTPADFDNIPYRRSRVITRLRAWSVRNGRRHQCTARIEAGDGQSRLPQTRRDGDSWSHT